ncbi:hypothetical protein Q0A17_23110 [Citrobacter sp. S2-9]|uniref:Uncharacterized protein n=1 Tax=Citrobacter enshiensis TaxID=2971264 RepID=A0ABT8Q1Q0_9ENTR|nr:hypothetical protein [Citrobacter enshiensis]MDN8602270.1 hypothetical protein [Citrobacter enshiensis]
MLVKRYLKMIEGVVVNQGELHWAGWRDLSLIEDPKLRDLPEFVMADSFKNEKRTLKDEKDCLYHVFYLQESEYHNIFSSFSIVEDSFLNELYDELKQNDRKPDYFIAFKLNCCDR